MSFPVQRNRWIYGEVLESRVHLNAANVSSFAPAAATGEPRTVIDLGPDWRFQRAAVAGAEAAGFNDTAWGAVNLPHTWNAQDGQDGGDDYYRGEAWYRKSLAVPAGLAGRPLYLKFDGASLVADVYLNGQFVGQHRGGFAAFTYDVTALLHPGGSDVLAVRVDNSNHDDVAPLSGVDVTLGGADFTFYGGLYRGVSLIATQPVHVTLTDYSSPGVYVKQSGVSRASANVEVLSKIENDTAADRDVTVVAEILDAGGAQVERLEAQAVAPAGSTIGVSLHTVIANPHLWNGRIDPYLYDVVVTVLEAGNVADVVRQPLGLRFFRFDPQAGFMLNGEPYALDGVNMHQDRVNKGWAVSPEDIAQDVALVEEVGATMVRLVHYQHAEQTYDLLDRAGIAVWTEIPYVFDDNAGPAFERTTKRQFRELIRQNYNHPSIFFWGLFNALYSDEVATELVPELNDIATAEDPGRLTIAATANRVLPHEKINHLTDAIGFNNYFGWYRGAFNDFSAWADEFHEDFPTRALGVAEYGAGGSTVQHADPPNFVDDREPWHPEEYQNLFHEAQWRQIAARPWLNFNLAFVMFDFAVDDRDEGDGPGRNDKGLITADRQTKKDVFHFYKANWSDEPVVYISSRRFVEREDRENRIKIYSNLDSVEVTINGRPLGALAGDEVNVFEWEDIPFDDGANVIVATATRNGQTFTDTVTWFYGDASTDPGAGGDGLSATYFDNDNFTGPSVSRIDSTINFDWGAGSPHSSIGPDTFSARWTGSVEAEFSELYTIYAEVNDGVRVWIGDQLVIDRWVLAGTTGYTGTVSLVAGQRTTIRVEYFEGGSNALVKLSWSSASRAKQIIPRGRLFSA